MKRILLGLALFTTNLYAADNFKLDNLNQSDVNKISKEFSANFVHTTVTGASSSKIFGFQLGIVGRQTSSPEIAKQVKAQSSSTNISHIYDAGIMALVQVPFGITAELTTLPSKDLGNLSFKRTSMAVKWTMTDGLLVLPFNLAIRGHYSTANLSFTDTINNSSTGNTDVNSTIGINTKSYGLNVTASMSLFVIEPYAGLGFVSSNTDVFVNASGGTTIFNFSSAQSASSTNSGLHYFAGAEVNLLLAKLGLEYSNVYGVDRLTAKLAVGF